MKKSTKLKPTIKVFNIGTLKEEEFNTIFTELTGELPIKVFIRETSQRKRNAIVRLSKLHYYRLISKSPNRVLYKFNSFIYEKLTPTRRCLHGGDLGHLADQCNADDDIKNLNIGKAADSARKCSACAYDFMIRQPAIHTANTLKLALTDVKRFVNNSTCPILKKHTDKLIKRYDF